MKITVISDTHREYARLKNVVEKNRDSGLFIHLGDGILEVIDIHNLYPDINFVFVKGNSDYLNSKEDRVVSVGGYRIFCTHGHKYNVHWEMDRLILKAKSKHCQIALYGHTHIYKTGFRDGIYIMNPGSLGRPRGRNSPSYGIIDISGNGKIAMNIIAYKE